MKNLKIFKDKIYTYFNFYYFEFKYQDRNKIKSNYKRLSVVKIIKDYNKINIKTFVKIWNEGWEGLSLEDRQNLFKVKKQFLKNLS